MAKIKGNKRSKSCVGKYETTRLILGRSQRFGSILLGKSISHLQENVLEESVESVRVTKSGLI